MKTGNITNTGVRVMDGHLGLAWLKSKAIRTPLHLHEEWNQSIRDVQTEKELHRVTAKTKEGLFIMKLLSQ